MGGREKVTSFCREGPWDTSPGNFKSSHVLVGNFFFIVLVHLCKYNFYLICWFKTLSLQGHSSKTGLLFVTLKFHAQTVLALKWKLLKFD